MDADAFEKKFNTMEVDFIRSQQLFCRDVLKLNPGDGAVISNGRVSGFQLQYSSLISLRTQISALKSRIDYVTLSERKSVG